MSNFPDLSSHHFKVIRELGHNRAGGRVTYLARNQVNHQLVVIKQFQFAQRNSNWSDYETIEGEIQVLRGLNHPGIPRYLGSFQTTRGCCLVQEYKHAPSLAVLRSFDPEEIKQIAVGLLNILVYLQHRIPPIIHRDIKPENILVDETINVFLVDFGLARIGDSELAVSTVAKGTIGFMAPEQLFDKALSKASDLYGLGATLICLLTGTRSTTINTLIDEDYCLNFQHRLPQVSLGWLQWLQRMVELKPKDRFPDAETALEALKPIYVIRIPEAKLSQSYLELRAKKLGEKLTKTITICNTVPDTALESRWQIAPHVSDPPHTPYFHDWIRLDTADVNGNQGLCQITIDTSKLMADQTYEREVLIHTNAEQSTQVLPLKIHTAPVPIATKKLPYLSLALLIGLATTATWVETTAWEGIVSNSGTIGIAIATFVSVLVAMLGLTAAVTSGVISKLVARLRARFSIPLKAMDTVAAVFFAGVAALLVAGFGAKFRATDSAIATFAAVDAVVFMAAFEGEGVAQSCRKRGFSKILALGVPVLSVALGISLGIGLKLGFLNVLVLIAILVTAVPLGVMILYPPLERLRQVKTYRKLERNLIKP
ncbi:MULTISPECIES: serine/threonine-protein kinase [unclassified Moorena]|uniref:serine/threonine protein kinase n=1 Tax=unclassified Moorena TaxID=2683338 RepID=UPI0013C19226|nr:MULTISPECIES: serine/threonine-protein kinase [unclassified Moorena]NEO05033.1 serine/threonine protein kinase [Moorena sp. SIO3I8]NEO18310.1 serine/threonine protein kinase [Moorena sp. SIO4A5]NEQ57401.1 serine/threonine protein kinase [Moorena sp. SIO4A1]